MSDADLIAAYLAKNAVKKCRPGQRNEPKPRAAASAKPTRQIIEPQGPQKFDVRLKTACGIVQHVIRADDAASASARAMRAYSSAEVISAKRIQSAEVSV